MRLFRILHGFVKEHLVLCIMFVLLLMNLSLAIYQAFEGKFMYSYMGLFASFFLIVCILRYRVTFAPFNKDER